VETVDSPVIAERPRLLKMHCVPQSAPGSHGYHVDEVSGVPRTDMASMPTDIGSSAVLLDVREDDEWQRGPAERATHTPWGRSPVDSPVITGEGHTGTI
jgi:hypothetical protein